MRTQTPKGYRFPICIIDYCIYCYHRFNLSYRDIEEMMAKGGVRVIPKSASNFLLCYFSDPAVMR